MYTGRKGNVKLACTILSFFAATHILYFALYIVLYVICVAWHDGDGSGEASNMPLSLTFLKEKQ